MHDPGDAADAMRNPQIILKYPIRGQAAGHIRSPLAKACIIRLPLRGPADRSHGWKA
jgi:hypothetical protein